MTEQQHPMTPPPDLLQQWAVDYWGNPGESIGEGEKYIAIQAARWGADMELEACVEWLKAKGWIAPEFSDELRTARRPKPPSLAEQALTLTCAIEQSQDPGNTWDFTTIRAALERLQELEQN